MNKRGISAIVATVLIILITVAAVTIIWIAIIPILQNDFAFTNSQVQLNIVTSGGYTFYDSKTDDLYVQIERGTDEEEIKEIHVIYIINGTSETFVVYLPDDIPKPNQMTSIIIPNIGGTPESVSIVPIYLSGESKKTGVASPKTTITSSSATSPVPEGGYTPGNDAEGNPIVDENGMIVPFTFLQATDTHIHIAGDPTASLNDGRTDHCGDMPIKYAAWRGGNLSLFPEIYNQYCNTTLYDSLGGSILPTIAWIDAVNKMNQIPNVGFSVITGDLVAQEVLDDNKKASIAKFVEIADTLNHDYYVVGAKDFHDRISISENYDYYVENIGPLDWNFTQGKSLFIGTSRWDLYLSEKLDYYKGQNLTLFVFVHIVKTELAELLESHLENYNEIIIVQGHTHINDYDYDGTGIHKITTTAIMNYPTEFRIFEIYEDRIESRMSNITSPEVNSVSETLVDKYIENYNQNPMVNPFLTKADPSGTKIGLAGDESERTITISLD